MAEAATLCDKAATIYNQAATYVLQVADDVYEMLQWQMDGSQPKPLRWHAQQQARHAYYGAMLTMVVELCSLLRFTHYGRRSRRAILTYAGELQAAILTMAGRGRNSNLARLLLSCYLVISPLTGRGRDGGLDGLVVQDTGARAAARLDRRGR